MERKPSWKITTLIETHNLSSPYAECAGCSICEMIEGISKQTGLWMKEETQKKYKKPSLTAKQLEELLENGYTRKQICAMTGLHKSTLRELIKRLLPNRIDIPDKDKITLNLEEYNRLKEQGLSRKEIAFGLKVSADTLSRHIWKLNKEEQKQYES